MNFGVNITEFKHSSMEKEEKIFDLNNYDLNFTPDYEIECVDDDKFQHDIEFQSKVNKWLEFWNFQSFTQVIHQILATNSNTSVKGRLYYLYPFNEKECPLD